MDNSKTDLTPVVTIDGPGGVGKGAVSMQLAQVLGWHYLDSGILYRVMAWIALEHQPKTVSSLIAHFRAMDLSMVLAADQVVTVQVNGLDVSDVLREERCSQKASELSQTSEVRAALLQRQRDMAVPPGLVTDGRDMGTVVFPDAAVKIYLDAAPEIRAQRRYKQLKEKGKRVSLDNIFAEMVERDHRDLSRERAPLKAAEDAYVIDTTKLSMHEVVAKIKEIVLDKLPLM